jgi:hypothetical protein
MALTAQAGIFGFGPQAAKDTIATTFRRHKAMNLGFGVMDDTRIGPLEIGGSPFPTFPYKAGYVVQGPAAFMPRMKDTFGWLLYATMGGITTTELDAAARFKHDFHPAVDKAQVRWLTLRKYIPMKDGDAATDLGETYTNCKPIGLGFSVAQDQPLQAQMDFLGTDYSFTDDVSSWVWANSYEDFNSIPVGCTVGGGLTFTGGGLTDKVLPAVRATIQMQNVPLDIQDEKVIGNPGLEDVTIVERRMTYDVQIKYNDPELYLAILTGSITGNQWTSTPFTGSLGLTVVSAGEIGSTGEPYKLSVTSPLINWRMTEPLALAAGQAVTMRFQGTVLEPNAGEYATISIENETAAYAWPTP